MIEPPAPEAGEPELALLLPSTLPPGGPHAADRRRVRLATLRGDGAIRSRRGQRIPGLRSTPARPHRVARPFAGRAEQAARPP
ncbi:MAG: hypothetical protein R3F21_14790 [Myxococcota bacterium]